MTSRQNQRTKLSQLLSKERHECMICCANIRRRQHTWSCPICYNVFHLDCIKKWARSSSNIDDQTASNNIQWRCPGCQTVNAEIPTTYYCFCGKMRNPSDQNGYYSTPHSCGDFCGRIGVGGPECNHACPDPCHPGRCDPCTVQIRRSCPCGKEYVTITCSSKTVFVCGQRCDKLLSCGKHRCEDKCHEGSCSECDVAIKLNCYCRRNYKYLACSVDVNENSLYTCGEKCDKVLTCGNHKCDQQCHAFCIPCKLSPSVMKNCPCGKTLINDVCKQNNVPSRKSCTDPIPVCGKVCGKVLKCGQREQPHQCASPCHVGDCPTCPLITTVKCRCGSKISNVACKDLELKKDFQCEKKCSKKRSCAKHKCNAKCCVDTEHICPILCDRQLRCGSHKCDLLCHKGHCPPCSSVSFEELTCECGNAVIYPPVPCGTKPPECSLPCSRIHACDHPVHHTCHTQPECPPCFVLTTKWCHGKHTMRNSVPCHVTDVSCGMPCGKLLKCGRHPCPKKCHAGDCMRDSETCTLPCSQPRSSCGHPCMAPCHIGDCPESKCKQAVEVFCRCGRIRENLLCWKRASEFDKILQGTLTSKFAATNLTSGGANADSNANSASQDKLLAELKEGLNPSQILKCDKECSRIERNRKMAEALQLDSPDPSASFGAPDYSDYMKEIAQKNPRFSEMVHEKLTALVLRTKELKNRVNATYQFEGFRRDRRQFIFEYAEHFGCIYNSIEEADPGVKCPIITASKDKCRIPSLSLVDAVFQKTVRTERKNVYADVEIQQARAQILGPGGNLKKLSGPR